MMNKETGKFDKFVSLFDRINKDNRQSLRFYLMICHPGDDVAEVDLLCKKIKRLHNIEQFQLFTPTPMSISSCMYWTGMNPFTLKPIKVVYDYHTKKKMKRMMIKTIT